MGDVTQMLLRIGHDMEMELTTPEQTLKVPGPSGEQVCRPCDLGWSCPAKLLKVAARGRRPCDIAQTALEGGWRLPILVGDGNRRHRDGCVQRI